MARSQGRKAAGVGPGHLNCETPGSPPWVRLEYPAHRQGLSRENLGRLGPRPTGSALWTGSRLTGRRTRYAATTRCSEDGNAYPATGELWAGAGQRAK